MVSIAERMAIEAPCSSPLHRLLAKPHSRSIGGSARSLVVKHQRQQHRGNQPAQPHRQPGKRPGRVIQRQHARSRDAVTGDSGSEAAGTEGPGRRHGATAGRNGTGADSSDDRTAARRNLAEVPVERDRQRDGRRPEQKMDPRRLRRALSPFCSRAQSATDPVPKPRLEQRGNGQSRGNLMAWSTRPGAALAHRAPPNPREARRCRGGNR
jgi:hypothetical protein